MQQQEEDFMTDRLEFGLLGPLHVEFNEPFRVTLGCCV
jgi:hypothetical protein